MLFNFTFTVSALYALRTELLYSETSCQAATNGWLAMFVCVSVIRNCGEHNVAIGCVKSKRASLLLHQLDAEPIKCYCDTDRCNLAIVTSSSGHVIIMAAVALLLRTIFGRLL